MNSAPRPLQVIVRRDQPYAEGLQLQRDTLAAMRGNPRHPETLIFAEHRPVITMGRTADRSHILLAPEALHAKGIECYQTTRGGDVTYHGTGQWTVYPILRIGEFCRDLHRYMRMLEDVVIGYLRVYGISAGRREINTGVWVGHDKICAIGVACSAWISWHGMAVNIQPDLRNFTECIVPCGITASDGGVTSLARETGKSYDMEKERRRLLAAFCEVFPFQAENPAG